jgi:hypothetical protein
LRVFLDLRAWPRAIASNWGLKIQEDPKMDSFPPQHDELHNFRNLTK